MSWVLLLLRFPRRTPTPVRFEADAVAVLRLATC
jgi:hypothetical protein